MVTTKTRRKFTYEDYRNTPDDIRYELLDGELIIMTSPSRVHQRLVLKLAGLFTAFVTAGNLGEILIAPFDVVFSPIRMLCNLTSSSYLRNERI